MVGALSQPPLHEVLTSPTRNFVTQDYTATAAPGRYKALVLLHLHWRLCQETTKSADAFPQHGNHEDIDGSRRVMHVRKKQLHLLEPNSVFGTTHQTNRERPWTFPE